MGKIVGIDLGTTTSSVSYLKNGVPTIIPNLEGKRTTDSVMGIDRYGNIIVGEMAKRMIGSKVEEVKRIMGTDRVIEIEGRTFTPEEVSAEILKKLKYDAEEFLGEEIEEAVITVPALFTSTQKASTIKAGELAGLKVERIISEPTAAAMAYGMENMDADAKILVYDFGGGTFDVSILDLDEGILDVIATSGDNHLGGKDIDNLLIKYIKNKIGRDDILDEQLKNDVEELKKTLSFVNASQLILPEYRIEMDVTRDELERLIKNLVDRSIELIHKALKEANLSVDDIDVVLPIGGTTRIPYIKGRLKELFGNKIKNFSDPQEAVALGASVQAGIKSQEISSEYGLIVTDICNYSLGIECIGNYQGTEMPGVFSVIIPKHSTLPCRKSNIYYTVHDNQTAIDVKVYQGENKLVVDNILLAMFTVDGIPAKPAGVERLKVTFGYSLNDILEVEAEIVSTGKRVKVFVDMKRTNNSIGQQNYRNSSYYSDYKTIMDMAESKMQNVSPENKKRIQNLLDEMKEYLIEEDEEMLKEIDNELTNVLFES